MWMRAFVGETGIDLSFFLFDLPADINNFQMCDPYSCSYSWMKSRIADDPSLTRRIEPKMSQVLGSLPVNYSTKMAEGAQPQCPEKRVARRKILDSSCGRQYVSFEKRRLGQESDVVDS